MFKPNDSQTPSFLSFDPSSSETSTSAIPNVEKIENSHLIQVTSPRRTIWRGHKQMKLHLSVKVDQRFLKTNLYAYNLIAYIENYTSKETKSHGEVENLTLDFYVKDRKMGGHMKYLEDDIDEKDSIRNEGGMEFLDSAVVEITSDDLYYELDVSIPKSMYQGGDKIRVIVEAMPLSSSCSTRTILFGASQIITICDLALVTENRFMNNNFVTMVEKNTYAWYKNSKFGANNALTVVIQIKDENGNPYQSPHPLPKRRLRTELVYENGSPAPKQPLSPLRDRQKKNPKLILNRMNGESKLCQMNHPVEFIFRIEEVIFHHSGRKGFKLNVSLEKPISSLLIHQAPMDDVIVVLSKPRIKKPLDIAPQSQTKKCKNVSSPESESTIGNQDLDEMRKLISTDEGRRIDGETDEVTETKQQENIAIIPLGAIIDSYYCLDACYCCNAIISMTSFLDPSKHANNCIFANQVLPLLSLMGVTQVHDYTHKPGIGASKVRSSSPVASNWSCSNSVPSQDNELNSHRDKKFKEGHILQEEPSTTTALDLVHFHEIVPDEVLSLDGYCTDFASFEPLSSNSLKGEKDLGSDKTNDVIVNNTESAIATSRINFSNHNPNLVCTPKIDREMEMTSSDIKEKDIESYIDLEATLSPIPLESNHSNSPENDLNLDSFDFLIGNIFSI